MILNCLHVQMWIWHPGPDFRMLTTSVILWTFSLAEQGFGPSWLSHTHINPACILVSLEFLNLEQKPPEVLLKCSVLTKQSLNNLRKYVIKIRWYNWSFKGVSREVQLFCRYREVYGKDNEEYSLAGR